MLPFSGLRELLSLAPGLLLAAAGLLGLRRGTDVFAALTGLLSPLLTRMGLPPETVPLMLLRPLSGSAALAVGGEIMAACGPDSPAGRTAAVMLGSTETTFYVLAVYFGAAGVRRTRHAVPAAVCADLAGFLAAAWCVRRLG